MYFFSPPKKYEAMGDQIKRNDLADIGPWITEKFPRDYRLEIEYDDNEDDVQPGYETTSVVLVSDKDKGRDREPGKEEFPLDPTPKPKECVLT